MLPVSLEPTGVAPDTPIHKTRSLIQRFGKRVYRTFTEVRRRLAYFVRIFQKGTLAPLLSQSHYERHRYQQKLQAKQKLRRYAFAAFVGLVACLLFVLTIYFLFAWLFSSVTPIVEVLMKLEGHQAFHDISRDTKNENRKEEVRNAFLHAWKGYDKFAFGHDEIRPVNNITNDSWGGWGVTIVDALDTIALMNFDHLLVKCEEHVSTIKWESDKMISVFETTIRYLGGLISAYDVTGKEIYLKKAKELSTYLLPAFNSKSGLPYHETNTKTGKSDNARWTNGESILSEIGSVQLEFKRLAEITSDADLYKKMSDTIAFIHKKQEEAYKEDPISIPKGLYPVLSNIDTGVMSSNARITFGGLADSFYEYLLKQYLFTGQREHVYLEWYLDSVRSMVKHMLKTYQHGNETLLVITEYVNGEQKLELEHLTCFVPGMIALGTKIKNETAYPLDERQQHWKVAQQLLRTCVYLYDYQPTGLAADTVRFDDDKITVVNPSYYLRPETVESLFYFYRMTGDESYREDGWRIFQNLVKHCKTKSSFSGIKDVTKVPPDQNNSMQSFFFAETLKYFYLLFSDQNMLPLDDYVFNTEGHPFKITKK